MDFGNVRGNFKIPFCRHHEPLRGFDGQKYSFYRKVKLILQRTQKSAEDLRRTVEHFIGIAMLLHVSTQPVIESFQVRKKDYS